MVVIYTSDVRSPLCNETIFCIMEAVFLMEDEKIIVTGIHIFKAWYKTFD